MVSNKIIKTVLIVCSCIASYTSVAQKISIPFKTDSTQNEIEFEGEIRGKDTIKTGSYIKYYLYSNATYEEGYFNNNRKHGLFITYYENKKKHWVRSYQNGLLFGNEEFYNIDEKLEFTGLYTILNNDSVDYKQYYPSGELKKTTQLINNNYQGKEVSFFITGDTNTVKTFENGVLNGPFEIRNEQGTKLQSGHYANGNLTGELATYYENNMLKSKGEFLNGRPNGPMVDYFPSGKTKRNCTYLNDTLVGLCTTFYENGQTATKANFFKGHFDKLYLSYYDNGQLKDSINYTRSQKDGESIHYDSDGNLLSKENFKLGIFNGKQLSYYPNKQLKKEFHYKNGHKTGQNYSYFEDGSIESILIFNSDDQITSQKTFWSNDQIKSMTKHKYKANKNPNSKYKITHLAKETNYYTNGNLESKGVKTNDKKTGEWKYYNDVSNLETQYKSDPEFQKFMDNHPDIYKYKMSKNKINRTTQYKADRKHGTEIIYYTSKIKKSIGHFINNKKSGVWQTYNPKGIQTQEANYKNNLLNGKYWQINEEGKTTGKYIKGKQSGTWITKKEGKTTKTEKYKNGNLVTK